MRFALSDEEDTSESSVAPKHQVPREPRNGKILYEILTAMQAKGMAVPMTPEESRKLDHCGVRAELKKLIAVFQQKGLIPLSPSDPEDE